MKVYEECKTRRTVESIQWKRLSEEDSNTGEQNKLLPSEQNMDISQLQLRIFYLDLFLPFAILLEVKAATLTLIKTD